MPRILVTNDDGITSEGLVVLARMARELGEVVVVAPDQEFSGASAALGPLHLIHPEVHEAAVQGIDEAWAVSGPPALCVYFARLGAFGGAPFDLVLAGINPGANVGRSVQHSGTVGAALTALSGGIPAVAVSQDAARSVEGQAEAANPPGQQWGTAATVGREVARELLAAGQPAVINLNVPNLPLEQVKGWRRTTLADFPRRGVGSAELLAVEGATDSFRVRMVWGEAEEAPEGTDVGAVSAGLVSLSVLTRVATDDAGPVAAAGALDDLVGRA